MLRIILARAGNLNQLQSAQFKYLFQSYFITQSLPKGSENLDFSWVSLSKLEFKSTLFSNQTKTRYRDPTKWAVTPFRGFRYSRLVMSQKSVPSANWKNINHYFGALKKLLNFMLWGICSAFLDVVLLKFIIPKEKQRENWDADFGVSISPCKQIVEVATNTNITYLQPDSEP